MGTVYNLSGDQIEVAPLPSISRKRQVRIRKVQELFDTGMKVSAIALCLDLSTRTIYSDLKDGKKLDQLFSKSLDQEEVIGREIRLLETARRMEWRAYRLETNHFVKVAIMRNIIALHEQLAKLLQGVGLINKVPDRLSVTSKINFKDDDVRAAYYKFLFLAREREEESPAF